MEYSFGKLGELNVGDVYDLAAEIGTEFEHLIGKHGIEVVTSLMPRVINALEHLEAFAISNEQKHDEISDLQGIIAKLEYENAERTEFSHKFEKEVEQVEESWKKEAKESSELVSRLQEENHRLSSLLLAEKEENFDTKNSKVDSVSDDVKLAQKLKELVDKQRNELHAKDMELLHRSKEIDMIQQKAEHLSQSNSEHSHRLKHLQAQMRVLVEEKSDLQAEVQDQQREIQVVSKKLSEAMKENLDLQGSPEDMRRKALIDKNDPNKPRFTLEELRNILFEKNDLKARVSELEDELSLYRPSKPRVESQSSSSTSGNDEPDASGLDDDDLPVQGPINREPDDKLFPGRKSMGIRRFFQSLWKGIETSEQHAITMVPFPAFRQSTGRF